VIHLSPLTLIRRERILPVQGRILVRVGQKISANDVIAESFFVPELITLDVAQSLKLTPRQADEYLEVQTGDLITEKTIIAGPAGVARRVIRAPGDGKIIQAENGRVLIQTYKNPFQLKAGISGEVVKIIGHKGVVIETIGALIQGMWGNGKIGTGIIRVVAIEEEHELTSSQISETMKGTVMFAGHCSNLSALLACEKIQLGGLILGSLECALIPAIQNLPVPVMILEGFGKRALSVATRELITTNEWREGALNACSWDRIRGSRPELVIPLQAPEGVTIPQIRVRLEKGQRVRILHPLRSNDIGEIQEIGSSMVLLNNQRVKSAVIRLSNGKVTIVPLANLELIV